MPRIIINKRSYFGMCYYRVRNFSLQNSSPNSAFGVFIIVVKSKDTFKWIKIKITVIRVLLT